MYQKYENSCIYKINVQLYVATVSTYGNGSHRGSCAENWPTL